MNSAIIDEKPAAECVELNPFRLPKHVAIIMDGNRRWAKKRGLPPMAGHWRGAETLNDIVRVAGNMGIEVLTVYAFSTENWKRPPMEVKALMRLFKSHLFRQGSIMVKEGVRFNVIGDYSRFPKDICKLIEKTLVMTKKGDKMDLVIALNYGGRDEIKRAVQSIVKDCALKKLSQEDLTEDLISSYLDTAKWKDPDLLIRTSGEYRISNFLLWQISYAEVVMTETLWPDFSEKDLINAIREYQNRELRLGK